MDAFSWCTRPVLATAAAASAAASAAAAHAEAGCSGCTRCAGCCSCCRATERCGELRLPPYQPKEYPYPNRPKQYPYPNCLVADQGEEIPLSEAAVRRLASLEDVVSVPLRQCPFCGNACVREPTSCDRQYCACGRSWCWECLADGDVTFHHGPHYHRPNCKLYRAYKEHEGKEPELVPNCPQCQATGRPCRPPAAKAPWWELAREVRATARDAGEGGA